MRLIAPCARAWLHFWRAVRYWRYCGCGWRRAWCKAARQAT